MVIHDLHVPSVAIAEAEAHSPLVVYADAPLPGAIVFWSFQPVRWGQAQIPDMIRSIQLHKPHSRARANLRPQPARFTRRAKTFRISVGKRANHESIINNMFMEIQFKFDFNYRSLKLACFNPVLGNGKSTPEFRGCVFATDRG